MVVDRLTALERGDYSTNGGRDRFMARLNIARLTEPDFIWTPYPAFISGLHQNTTGIAANWMHTWTPRLTSELKLSYSDDDLWWNRAHPDVPTLRVRATARFCPAARRSMPTGTTTVRFETIYSTVWTRNRHVITAGVGLLFRFNSGYLTAGRDGEYIFPNLLFFSIDQPQYFRASDRPACVHTHPAGFQPELPLHAELLLRPGQLSGHRPPDSELWIALRALRRSREYRSRKGCAD